MEHTLRTFIAVAALAVGAKAFALDLVRDGKAACAIIIPDESTQLEREGAQTLVKYIEMASGATLPILKESEKPVTTFVSVGKTGMAERAGVTDRRLDYDGYRLQVKAGTLYLLGRDTKIIMERRRRIGAQGSRRAALGLLEKLGFRWVQPTPMGLHVPRFRTVSVPDDLDVTHTPAFGYVAGRMYTWGDWSLANSYRKAVLVYSAGGHTWCLAIPVSLAREHPEYCRMQGGKRTVPIGGNYQLCPSNPDVIQRIADFTIRKFDEGYELVALGQPDGWKPCECDACRAMTQPDEEYEQVHIAQNRIIRKVYEKHPDRNVHLLIYGPSSIPSSVVEKYPPNTMAEVCGGTEEQLRLWESRIPSGSTVYVYYMGLYHRIGLGPTFTPRQASEKIRLLRRYNVKGIYYCGGGEKWATEGPTYYVLGRLATDPSQDWREAFDEYCDLTFGRASVTMRQYYDLLHRRIENCYGSGRKLTGYDLFPAIYTPDAIDRLDGLLDLARSQAVGDERALGWIRLAKIGYDHCSLLATAYRLYQTYQTNRTMNNLVQVREAVKAYHAFADSLLSLPTKDPGFLRNYFPGPGSWVARKTRFGSVRTNSGKLSSPFTWDLDALVKEGVLPGKTRARAAFARLPAAPVMDGDPYEEAWKNAPWLDVRQAALAETVAKTRVRLGYDSDNLYFAFECDEPRFDEMKIIEHGRDGRVFWTECVEVFLAPDGVGQKRVHLIVSPTKDGIWDGRHGYIDDPLDPLALSDRPDTSWNPHYTHAWNMDRNHKRWTMEIAFPFAELGVTAPAEGTRWRGNFGRERHMRTWNPKKYGRQKGGGSEYFLWSPNLQRGAFTDPASFGDLYFGKIPDQR